MSWIKTLAVALAAEAAGYFLSLSWGFLLLIAAFIVTGLQQQMTSAKAADTERRINALVPVVGGIKDTADYAQGRADTAYTNAGNAQSTANSAQSTANSAQTAANNANSNANGRVSKGGDSMSGNLSTTGTMTAGWDVHADNALYVGSQRIMTVSGPSPPGAGVTWNDSQLTNAVHAIIDTLAQAGIYW